MVTLWYIQTLAVSKSDVPCCRSSCSKCSETNQLNWLEICQDLWSSQNTRLIWPHTNSSDTMAHVDSTSIPKRKSVYRPIGTWLPQADIHFGSCNRQVCLWPSPPITIWVWCHISRGNQAQSALCPVTFADQRRVPCPEWRGNTDRSDWCDFKHRRRGIAQADMLLPKSLCRRDQQRSLEEGRNSTYSWTILKATG